MADEFIGDLTALAQADLDGDISFAAEDAGDLSESKSVAFDVLAKAVKAPITSALASAFTKSNATLGNTALAIALEAGKTYKIEGLLEISNSVAGEGAKFNFNGDTNLTATKFFATIHGATDVSATSLSGSLVYATVTGTVYLWIRGVIVVNAGGSLTLKAAENTTSAGTLTISNGSWLSVQEI